MNKLTDIINNSTIKFIIWIFIFIIPIIFIWQDGDLTDTGYYLTIYHFFFERLNQGTTDSVIFLTELIGGSFFKIFPELGIYNIKILCLLFIYGNVIISYVTLKKIFSNIAFIPFLILISILFNIKSFPIIFNYDIVTSTFLLLFIYLLTPSKRILKSYNFILIGLFTGLATLSRLPNFILLFIIPIVLIIGYRLKYINHSKKEIISFITLFYLSTIISFIAIYTIMYFMGVSETLTNNMLTPNDLLENNIGSYSIFKVIKVYILDLVFFSIYFILTLLIIYLFKLFYSNNNFAYLTIVLLFLISFYPITLDYNNSIKYIVPSLILISIIQTKIKREVRWILLLVFSFILVQIAGSNTGIFLKSSLLFVLLIPLTFNALLTTYKVKNYKFFTLSISYIFILSSIIYIMNIYAVGQGPFIRFKAIYPVENPKYKNTYTKKNLSNKITNISNDLIRLNNNKNKELFIFGHEPLFYYLSDLLPADKEIWLVGNSLAKPEFVFARMKINSKLPIILDTKQNFFSEKAIQSKNDFLKHNHYQLVKSTKDYDIWIPPYLHNHP